MGYFTCRIKVTQGTTCILRDLHNSGHIAFDHYHTNNGDYVLELHDSEIKTLQQCGIKVQREADLQALAATRKKERAPKKKRVRNKSADDNDDFLSTGFVDHYMDAVEVTSRIQALATEFPTLCSVSMLPYTTSGYDGATPGLGGAASVPLLRITTTPGTASKPGLLLVSGTHAREWVNPLIAIEFAEQLLRNYAPGSADPDKIIINRIVDEADIFIVPVMNPDGLNYSFHDDTGWRKNRRPTSSPGCPGIDNNRNYEIYFGGAGSSDAPCSDSYRGDSAFSEQENKNIRYILDTFPNIVIGVDSHSQGQKILRPIATGGTFISSLPVSAEDEVIYQQLEAAAVAAIQGVSGITYETGSTSNHAGASDEYMFFAHRVYAFDFECALAHQPPLAQALIAIQEVTAALRALAFKAVDLELTPPAHISTVQCIDRTGSMITFGYDAGARSNARRFVDLMSPGDQAAVVSFADPSPDPNATPFANRARIDIPLTTLTPGAYAGIQSGINALSFGGWTSIGAGLSKSIDALSGATHPRSVVLLSDGFENREPWVNDVLAGFPGDTRVYTIALGSFADTTLLGNIATETGGRFYLSPTPLELHEIYNQIRTDVSDDGLILNSVVDNDDTASDIHIVHVERNAAKLTISMSWEDAAAKPELVVYDPAGRRVCPDDWKVMSRRSAGYLLTELRWPRPGAWTIHARRRPAQYTVAAFVQSPLKLRLGCLRGKVFREAADSVLVQAKFGDRPISQLAGMAMLTTPPIAMQMPSRPGKRPQLDWTDTIPDHLRLDIRAEMTKRPADTALLTTRLLPFGYPKELMECGKDIHVKPSYQTLAHSSLLDAIWKDSDETTRPMVPLFRFPFPEIRKQATSVVRLRLEGSLPDGSPFERVGLITLCPELRAVKS